MFVNNISLWSVSQSMSLGKRDSRCRGRDWAGNGNAFDGFLPWQRLLWWRLRLPIGHCKAYCGSLGVRHWIAFRNVQAQACRRRMKRRKREGRRESQLKPRLTRPLWRMLRGPRFVRNSRLRWPYHGWNCIKTREGTVQVEIQCPGAAGRG